MNTNYTIEKLTDKNYLVWSTQMQLVLESKGLWKFVDGTARGRAATDTDKDYREKRQCLAEMILNIDTKFVSSVMSKREPKDVWDALKAMHKSKSAANQFTLRRRVLNLRMGQDQSVRSYVNSIYEIENELALTGYELSADDKKFALLEGLDEGYSVVKTILQNDTELAFEDMVSRLEAREDEISRENDSSLVEDESTMKRSGFYTGRGKENKYKNYKGQHRDRSKLSCHICSKEGHKAFDCYFNPKSRQYKSHWIPTPETRERLQRWLDNGRPEGNQEEEAQFAFTSAKGNLRGKWFLDSCASQHMTNDRDALFNFRDANSMDSVSTAAENVGMNIEGYGTVRLEQDVGGRVNIIELRDVAYMPSIRTNLISLSKAQAAGISVMYPPNSTKMIAKKNGSVVMIGSGKKHNICELTGMRASKRKAHKHVLFAAKEDRNTRMNGRMSHIGVSEKENIVKLRVTDGEVETGKDISCIAVSGDEEVGSTVVAEVDNMGTTLEDLNKATEVKQLKGTSNTKPPSNLLWIWMIVFLRLLMIMYAKTTMEIAMSLLWSAAVTIWTFYGWRFWLCLALTIPLATVVEWPFTKDIGTWRPITMKLDVETIKFKKICYEKARKRFSKVYNVIDRFILPKRAPLETLGDILSPKLDYSSLLALRARIYGWIYDWIIEEGSHGQAAEKNAANGKETNDLPPTDSGGISQENVDPQAKDDGTELLVPGFEVPLPGYLLHR